MTEQNAYKAVVVTSIKLLLPMLEMLDCGSNGCVFAKEIKGQRTNDGCTCLSDFKFHGRQALTILHQNKKDLFYGIKAMNNEETAYNRTEALPNG